LLERNGLIRLVEFYKVVLFSHAYFKLQDPKLLLQVRHCLFGCQYCNHNSFWSSERSETKGSGRELGIEGMPLLYRDHLRVCQQIQSRCVDHDTPLSCMCQFN